MIFYVKTFRWICNKNETNINKALNTHSKISADILLVVDTVLYM
jgi:hypothetical protein